MKLVKATAIVRYYDEPKDKIRVTEVTDVSVSLSSVDNTVREKIDEEFADTEYEILRISYK